MAERRSGSMIDVHYEECVTEAFQLLSTNRGRDSPINHSVSEFVYFYLLPLASKCMALMEPHTILLREFYEKVLIQCMRGKGLNASDDALMAVKSCVNGKLPKRDPVTLAETASLYQTLVNECLVPALTCAHSAGTEFGLARNYGQPG